MVEVMALYYNDMLKVKGLKIEIQDTDRGFHFCVVHEASNLHVVKSDLRVQSGKRAFFKMLNSELEIFNWEVNQEEMQDDKNERLIVIRKIKAWRK